jgi:hypothetical protein
MCNQRRNLAPVAALTALAATVGCAGDVDIKPTGGAGGPATGGPATGGPAGGGDPAAPAAPAPPPFVLPPSSGEAPPPPAAPGGPSFESNCGLEKFNLERTPARVLLVLDRSRSMRDKAMGVAVDKWTDVVGAVDAAVLRTNETISWGLKMFPSGATIYCAVDRGIDVPIAARNHTTVLGMINDRSKGGPNGHGTPTRQALTDAVEALRADPATDPKFILLATDGEPTCMDGKTPALRDDSGAVAAVTSAAAAGFPVFVVGVATGAAGDGVLNAMATAGGRPRAGATRYYAVATRQELVDAFGQITGQVASCTFKLGKAPPSPKDVAVNVGTTRVPRDPQRLEGWDYNDDRSAIELHGKYCADVKASTSVKVEVIFGCPNVIIP